jgi:hypothetical protein
MYRFWPVTASIQELVMVEAPEFHDLVLYTYDVEGGKQHVSGKRSTVQEGFFHRHLSLNVFALDAEPVPQGYTEVPLTASYATRYMSNPLLEIRQRLTQKPRGDCYMTHWNGSQPVMVYVSKLEGRIALYNIAVYDMDEANTFLIPQQELDEKDAWQCYSRLVLELAEANVVFVSDSDGNAHY